MRNLIIILIVLMCSMVVTPKKTFAGNPFEYTDVIVAPMYNAGLLGVFGGYIGGSGDWVDVPTAMDWSIGNTIPFCPTRTDDMVFSTNTGSWLNPLDWKERMRITKDGKVAIVGNVSVRDSLNVGSDVAIGRTLNVGKNVAIGGTLDVGSDVAIVGNVSVSDSLNVGSDVAIGRNLNVGKNVALGGTLDVGSDVAIVGNVSVGDSLDVGSDVVIGSTLNVGKDVAIGGNLNVSGTKNFVQPHPMDPAREIVYVAVEAPESIVIQRGTAQLKNGKAVIRLPEHFRVVAAEKGVQAQVTPLEDCNGIFIESKNREIIVVKELMGGKHNARFDYLATAERAGFEGHKPVVANTHFRPGVNETSQEFEDRYSKNDMPTKVIRAMLISNGILTEEGKLNMTKVKGLGWVTAEDGSLPKNAFREKQVVQR